MSVGYNRKNKTYYYRGKIYYKGETVKEFYKSGYESRVEAAKAEKEFRNSYVYKKKALPLETLFKRFLEFHKTRVKESTYKTDAYVYKKILKNFTGDYTEPKKWQAYIDELDSKFTKRHVAKEYSCLRKAFNWAVKNDYMISNPMLRVYRDARKNERKKEMLFWEPSDFNRFIKCFEDDIMYETLFMLLYYMGCRKGEALALHWRDVDFNSKTITIDKTIDFMNGKRESPPKTNNSYRTITMPNVLVHQMKRWYAESSTWANFDGEDSYVFGNDTVLAEQTIRRRLNKGVEIVNGALDSLKDPLRAKMIGPIPRIRVHDFRHSHASYLINNMNKGFTDYDIAKRLGDTIETLHNTYSHWFKTKDEDIINFMNQDTK